MAENNHRPPGFITLARRIAVTGIGTLQNRAELLAVEWQEERTRQLEMFIWAVGLLFLGMTGALLLTATIIFSFPEKARLYVAAGFTLLYLLGAVGAWLGLKSLFKQQAFSESLEQVRKDRVWLETLK